MKPGQKIKLRAYGDEELVRTVIRLEKKSIVVCRPEEYEAALAEGREPVGVGFNIKDILASEVEVEA